MASTKDLPLPLSQSHRRIDLQSPSDLSYLLNNARSAARAKIDLHLPLSAALQLQAVGDNTSTGAGVADGDAMRTAVEASVDKYIENVFEMVRLGVEVNGIEGEKVDWVGLNGPEEYEPYNASLAHRITALHSEIEALNLSLADTRREAVVQAAARYQEEFLNRSAKDDEALEKLQIDAVSMGMDEVGEMEKLGFENRQEDVRRVWEGAVERLKRLGGDADGGLLSLKGRADGAVKVTEYLEGR